MKKNIIFILLFLLFKFSRSQINTALNKENGTENPKENFYPLLKKTILLKLYQTFN